MAFKDYRTFQWSSPLIDETSTRSSIPFLYCCLRGFAQGLTYISYFAELQSSFVQIAAMCMINTLNNNNIPAVSGQVNAQWLCLRTKKAQKIALQELSGIQLHHFWHIHFQYDIILVYLISLFKFKYELVYHFKGWTLTSDSPMLLCSRHDPCRYISKPAAKAWHTDNIPAPVFAL